MPYCVVWQRPGLTRPRRRQSELERERGRINFIFIFIYSFLLVLCSTVIVFTGISFHFIQKLNWQNVSVSHLVGRQRCVRTIE